MTSSDNIGLHLKNIFKEGELSAASVAEEFSVTGYLGSVHLFSPHPRRIRNLFIGAHSPLKLQGLSNACLKPEMPPNLISNHLNGPHSRENINQLGAGLDGLRKPAKTTNR